MPAVQLRTDYAAVKTFLLSLITFSIYFLITMMNVGNDVNTVATPKDGKQTMNYILLVICAPFTLGIAYFVWNHRLCNRIKAESDRRNIPCELSAGNFWLWSTIGLITVVGPWIYIHKLFTAVNNLNADYNANG